MEHQSDPNLYSHIQSTQSNYYSEHGGKNMVFKKAQKFECAETVCTQIPLIVLMQKTFWIIPSRNQIYFEYPLFKMYAHPGNFMEITDYVISLCLQCKHMYNTFSLHVNFEGFTISAAERYKQFVVWFNSVCETRNHGFLLVIEQMIIYNTSNTMDHISSIFLPLIPNEMRPKIRIIGKEESKELLEQLLA